MADLEKGVRTSEENGLSIDEINVRKSAIEGVLEQATFKFVWLYSPNSDVYKRVEGKEQRQFPVWRRSFEKEKLPWKRSKSKWKFSPIAANHEKVLAPLMTATVALSNRYPYPQQEDILNLSDHFFQNDRKCRDTKTDGEYGDTVLRLARNIMKKESTQQLPTSCIGKHTYFPLLMKSQLLPLNRDSYTLHRQSSSDDGYQMEKHDVFGASMRRVSGVKVRMVTSDDIKTAQAVTGKCGIFTPKDDFVLKDYDFCKAPEDEYLRIRPYSASSALLPPIDRQIHQQKVRDVPETVAVTGDGTIDGPALKAADVGLSMDIAGTEVAAEEVSAIILMDDNFSSWLRVLTLVQESVLVSSSPSSYYSLTYYVVPNNHQTQRFKTVIDVTKISCGLGSDYALWTACCGCLDRGIPAQHNHPSNSDAGRQ